MKERRRVYKGFKIGPRKPPRETPKGNWNLGLTYPKRDSDIKAFFYLRPGEIVYYYQLWGGQDLRKPKRQVSWEVPSMEVTAEIVPCCVMSLTYDKNLNQVYIKTYEAEWLEEKPGVPIIHWPVYRQGYMGSKKIFLSINPKTKKKHFVTKELFNELKERMSNDKTPDQPGVFKIKMRTHVK